MYLLLLKTLQFIHGLTVVTNRFIMIPNVLTVFIWIDWQFSWKKLTSFNAMSKDWSGALWDALLGMCWLVIAHSCRSLDVNCQLISSSSSCILKGNKKGEWEVGNIEKRKRFVAWAEERDSYFPFLLSQFPFSMSTLALSTPTNISMLDKEERETEERKRRFLCFIFCIYCVYEDKL